MNPQSNTPVDSTVSHVLRSLEDVAGRAKLAASRITRHIDLQLRPFGFSYAQVAPLRLLHDGTCRTAVEITRVTHCDAGAMARTLGRLESRGLLARSRSSHDRRVVDLVLTPAGLEVARALQHIMDSDLHRLDGLVAEEYLGPWLAPRRDPDHVTPPEAVQPATPATTEPGARRLLPPAPRKCGGSSPPSRDHQDQ